MNLLKENAIQKETDQILENMQNNHKTGLLLTRKEVLQLCEKRNAVLVHTAEFRSYYDGNYWNRIGGTPESARRISGTTQ